MSKEITKPHLIAFYLINILKFSMFDYMFFYFYVCMYVLDSSIKWVFGFNFDSQPMDMYVL